MKHSGNAIALFCVLLTACTSLGVKTETPVAIILTATPTIPPPTHTPTFTSTPTETLTRRPTITPLPTDTRTPKPTNTPIPELTVADVGLPWNPDEVKGRVRIMPCYLFTSTLFHAGDGFYFPPGNAEIKYNVVAPVGGKIIFAQLITEGIGWGIDVQTPYQLDGKVVYYHVVHSSGLAPGLKVGMSVNRGDVLAIKTKNNKLEYYNQWLIDIGFRTARNAHANASLPDWTGLNFFSYTRLILDDLALLDWKQYLLAPKCDGNPIQQNKPYATPTPGGFTYP